eukprot:6735456-Prymnesium_polylepis.1
MVIYDCMAYGTPQGGTQGATRLCGAPSTRYMSLRGSSVAVVLAHMHNAQHRLTKPPVCCE